MSQIFFRQTRLVVTNSIFNFKSQNERLLPLICSRLNAYPNTVCQRRNFNFIFSPSKWFCMHEQRRWSNLDRPPWEQLTVASVQEKVVNACKSYDKINADKNKCPIYITKRGYAEKVPLSIDFVEQRAMLVLQLYDKVDPDKLTLDSHFVNDLGLDSLDHVEVVMAMEDEFGFEIPDRDAERLMTPRAIARYVCDREDIYE